uniref:Uncharacterized protein n=1 Tax=mine drainage metagenome TaxID=410659 RepID=E6QCD9_9ZZZZ
MGVLVGAPLNLSSGMASLRSPLVANDSRTMLNGLALRRRHTPQARTNGISVMLAPLHTFVICM